MTTNRYSVPTYLSPWGEERAALFATHGGPFSPGYRAAKRSMPLVKRVLFNVNLWAFVFGPLYFFARGLWRKGAVILAGLMVLWTLEAVFAVPTQLHIFGMSTCFLQMACANYAIYLKRVRGVEGWNPFEGMGGEQPAVAV